MSCHRNLFTYTPAIQVLETRWLVKGKRQRDRPMPAEPEVRVGKGPMDSIRPEKVERARRLVADPDYPPKEVTEAVARLLARNMDPSATGSAGP